MLESQTSKPQENDGWTASDKKYFLIKHQFGSPKMLNRSATQRNRHLLRCKINRSLNFDFNFSRKNHSRRLSPNSMNHSCFSMNKPSRELSRSAKIMRALSSDISFRNRNENIKKSLQFEFSSEKTNSSDESTSVESIVNTPVHTPDKSLGFDKSSTDSSATSNAPSVSSESIDENQNRTPQQIRKVGRIVGDTSNTKRSASKSRSSGSRSSSTSSLRSNMKEKIDSIICNTRTPDFQYLKQYGMTSGYAIAASTPRNLSKEFGNDEEDSPHTPENMIRLIPEGMSSIKKCHKKERFSCVEKEALKIDDPVRNENLCAKGTTESLETDDILTSSSSATKESPKKSRNVKKILVYNLDDEFSDNELIVVDAKQKAAPKNIDSSDSEMCEENTQDIHDTLPSTSSNNDEKENDSNLQEATSSNVDLAESGNNTTFEKFNPLIDLRTPYIIHPVSPPKPTCFREQWPEMTIAKSTSYTDPNLNQLLTVWGNKRHAFENKRPITPENTHSSRLLLSQYMSVKKSHKKDKKKNKSISDISYVMDNEVRSSSSDGSNQKRKKGMSMSMQDYLQLAYSGRFSPRCQNVDNEFTIHTPKKRTSFFRTLTNYVCKEKTPLERDNESTEVADTIDANGRLTPINMSTAELLCNKNSIKKSHKKDKHDGSICRRRNLGKKLLEYTKETGNMNIADYIEILEDRTTPSLKLNPNGGSFDETGACSSRRNEDRKSNEESIYDPQPSTSRENSLIESTKNPKKLQLPSTTPPNNLSTLKFMKLQHATSIKKSHKKERDLNAQSKYILMNHEYDLSDDGSIFDEEDKLTYDESPCKYNNN
ncbi:uncharacterized protein LOC116853824 isoform X2 [Odontomachus brunneus]|uniref:uncharacterized protein LOC116853824 isoform X2 n=1 Tax=Odontomachus brunneus TaxID=486640 RepID=UPI0013F18C33|nr:uncharacterized protein LOC116853824 isoform X2 [Odontomachus brunneus]XP_032690969.1 uncharacterized protein LOC116853824 isoform X2 [Odontomachus brunneus]